MTGMSNIKFLNTVQVDEKKPPVFDKGTLGFLFFFRVLPFLSNWDAGPRQGYPWFLNRFMNWSLAPGTFGNWHAKTIFFALQGTYGSVRRKRTILS